MLIHIPNVLTPEELQNVRSIIEQAAWVDGKATAGDQAAKAKYNLQIAEGSEAGMKAGDIILRALGPTEKRITLMGVVFAGSSRRSFESSVMDSSFLLNVCRPA